MQSSVDTPYSKATHVLMKSCHQHVTVFLSTSSEQTIRQLYGLDASLLIWTSRHQLEMDGRIADGEIEIEWMTRPQLQNRCWNIQTVKCKTGCLTNRCSCKKASLKCTELCSCAGCRNEASVDGNGDE